MSDAREPPPKGEVPFKNEVSLDAFKSIFRADAAATAIGRAILILLWVAAPLAAICYMLFEFPGPIRGASADAPPTPPASQPVDMSHNRGANAYSAHGPAISQSGGGTQNNAGVGNTGTQNNVGNTENHSITSSSGRGRNQSVNITGGSFGPGTSIRSGDVNNVQNNVYNGLDLETIEKLQRPDIDKLTPQQLLNRYIDSSAERMPDQPNVALHMLPIKGFEVTALQDAASSALIDLGYHVPTLFRRHFTSDELDKELFHGSAKLAKQLRLKEHCDGVLLGEVRLNPPNNLQGLFITEATMYLHQIAADSGTITKNLVIRAKGSGTNADTSAASALRELEENLKQQLSEWTLK
jgi:hypothetical protein